MLKINKIKYECIPWNKNIKNKRHNPGKTECGTIMVYTWFFFNLLIVNKHCSLLPQENSKLGNLIVTANHLIFCSKCCNYYTLYKLEQILQHGEILLLAAFLKSKDPIPCLHIFTYIYISYYGPVDLKICFPIFMLKLTSNLKLMNNFTTVVTKLLI